MENNKSKVGKVTCIAQGSLFFTFMEKVPNTLTKVGRNLLQLEWIGQSKSKTCG